MLDFGFYNADCMEHLRDFPDNYFDLAVVDPPYGGGSKDYDATTQRFGGHFSRYFDNQPEVKCERMGGRTNRYTIERDGRGWAKKYGYNICDWDVAPGEDYFRELFRVSKNQIIWGGNYFELPPTRCFLIWRKLSISESFTMAMCEYAWTSFNDNAKMFECTPQGRPGEGRFHPTQKPVALYEWILNRYAKPGDIILDTHAGSGSSLIACRHTGHKYVAFEIDPTYYEKAKKRVDDESAQMTIYDFLQPERL